MFDSKDFKKAALSQLKGRWKTPCLVTLTMLVIFTITSSSTFMTEGTAGFFISAFVYGSSILAITSLYRMLFLYSNPVTYSDFISGFSQFIRGTLAFLWMSLWITIWSFLFVIPGIVKGFAYSQMFYILSENPDVGIIKAMNISKVLTKGHKADLFILTLTFIGWNFLSILTCGILFIWVIPYMTMTFTDAYYYLKQEALRTGKLTPADFEK